MQHAGTRVAIIGAGPYGLALAAHLRHEGIEPKIFGEALDFWDKQMPKGMLLRSSWDASHISDPTSQYSLDAYQDDLGETFNRPLPLNRFVEYGRWVQRHVAPDLDARRVQRIERVTDGLRLHLEDGETVSVDRVLVAAGIKNFPSRPRELADVPSSLASHTVEHQDLGIFAGKRVAVIGGGQCAVESLALLRENGAEAELIMRRPFIRWLRQSSIIHGHGDALTSLLYHRTDVGPPGLSQLVARPNIFRILPHEWQDRLAYRAIRPAAAAWLQPRVDERWVTAGRSVVGSSPQGETLELRLDDGSTRTVDHAILATGYQVDISKYEFLDEPILRHIRTMNGYPVLNSGFESTVPGLHFVGAPAAWSFGPLMRFVSGSEFTAGTVTRAIRDRAA